jgi:hypothetical protein
MKGRSGLRTPPRRPEGAVDIAVVCSCNGGRRIRIAPARTPHGGGVVEEEACSAPLLPRELSPSAAHHRSQRAELAPGLEQPLPVGDVDPVTQALPPHHSYVIGRG